MTSAKAAFGVVLKKNGTAIAEIYDIPPIRKERGLINVTNHGSSGGYEENIPAAIIQTGEFAFKANWIASDAGQAAIKSQWAAKTEDTYTVEFPDGTTFTGSAIVLAYEVEAPMEAQLSFSATLKWTGELAESTAYATAPTDLAITTATLYPAFDDEVYDYVAVSTADTCTLTLTFATATAKLYRAGVYVQDLVTATPSGNISLGADGANTELSVVLSEANKAPLTYKIKVANAAA